MSGRAGRRWTASFASLVLALSMVSPAAASPSGDEPVGTTTSTSLPVATSNDVLVPGDGTEGAESTTTTVPTTTTVSEDSGDDGTLVALVVAGLVLVALAVAVLTWRYWAATRPPPVGSDHG